MPGMWQTFDAEQDDDLVRALARQELQNRQGLAIAEGFEGQRAARERSALTRDTLEMNRESRAESADIRRLRAEAEAEERGTRIRDRDAAAAERTQVLQRAEAILKDPNASEQDKQAANAILLGVKPSLSISDKPTRVPVMLTDPRNGTIRQIGETDPNAKIVTTPAPETPRSRGELTPTAESNLINRLNSQYNANTKAQREVLGQYAKMQGAMEAYERGDFTARDPMAQTILVTFQKILDPISVVRESEYDRSIQGQAFLDRIWAKGKQLLEGGPAVTDEMLRQYVKEAKVGVQIAKQLMDEEKARIGSVADRYNIPKDLILGQSGGSAAVPEAAADTPTTPSAGGRRVVRDANGKLVIQR